MHVDAIVYNRINTIQYLSYGKKVPPLIICVISTGFVCLGTKAGAFSIPKKWSTLKHVFNNWWLNSWKIILLCCFESFIIFWWTWINRIVILVRFGILTGTKLYTTLLDYINTQLKIVHSLDTFDSHMDDLKCSMFECHHLFIISIWESESMLSAQRLCVYEFGGFYSINRPSAIRHNSSPLDSIVAHVHNAFILCLQRLCISSMAIHHKAHYMVHILSRPVSDSSQP